jgi:hypothetical protein
VQDFNSKEIKITVNIMLEKIKKFFSNRDNQTFVQFGKPNKSFSFKDAEQMKEYYKSTSK